MIERNKMSTTVRLFQFLLHINTWPQKVNHATHVYLQKKGGPEFPETANLVTEILVLINDCITVYMQLFLYAGFNKYRPITVYRMYPANYDNYMGH